MASPKRLDRPFENRLLFTAPAAGRSAEPAGGCPQPGAGHLGPATAAARESHRRRARPRYRAPPGCFLRTPRGSGQYQRSKETLDDALLPLPERWAVGRHSRLKHTVLVTDFLRHRFG